MPAGAPLFHRRPSRHSSREAPSQRTECKSHPRQSKMLCLQLTRNPPANIYPLSLSLTLFSFSIRCPKLYIIQWSVGVWKNTSFSQFTSIFFLLLLREIDSFLLYKILYFFIQFKNMAINFAKEYYRTIRGERI